MQDWYEQRLSELEDRTQELEKICGVLMARLSKAEGAEKAARDTLLQAEETNRTLTTRLRVMQEDFNALSNDMENVIKDINAIYDWMEALDGDDDFEDDDFEDDEYDDFDDADTDESDDDDIPPEKRRRWIRFFK